MGQFSCKGWDCKHSDLADEFRTSDLIFSQGFKSNLPPHFNGSHYLNNKSSLISLQASIKKFIYKTRYHRQLKKSKPPYYYFSYEEVAYFLSKTSKLPEYRENSPGHMYNHGGLYTGELRGGFRDGQGTMQWKDGARYSGTWCFGRPSGMGTFLFPDGETYKGEWRYYFSKGSENDIKGLGLVLWKENIQDGYKWLWYKKSICINSPRSISMTPRNEEQLQQVQETYSALKAIFDKNLMQVRTVKEPKERNYPDGSMYKGDLQGGSKHGFGKMQWADGDSYEGSWLDDTQSGWGQNKWKEGSSYSGFFVNNLKEGVGKYSWEDGTEYFGEWKANKMNGIGKYLWNDGKAYLGEWVDGCMQGFGVLMFKDGRKYEGSWLQGKKHGEGLTFYSSGKVSRDVWRHGKIIRPDV